MDFTQALQPAAEAQGQQSGLDLTGAQGAQEQQTDGGQAAAASDAGATGADGGQQQSQQQPTAGQQPSNQNNATGAPAAGQNDDQLFYASLDRMSGGRFKDEQGFRSALDQLNEFPTLKQQHEELAARMAQAPVFANDEVRIYNELVQGGASREKINAFLQINQLGDLSQLSDKDALKYFAVMVKDSKETAAELRIARDYKLNDDSLSEDERELLNDDMRVAAREARKELAKYKAEVSASGQQAPEEVRLATEARQAAHQAAVKPYAKDVVASIPHMGEFTMVQPGKDGQGAVKYTIPMDDATRTTLGQYVENYFMDGQTPINEVTTREALSYAWAEHFRLNAERILAGVYQDAVAKTTERLVNKYENRSGVDNGQDRPLVNGGNDAQSMAQFMSGVANRNVAG